MTIQLPNYARIRSILYRQNHLILVAVAVIKDKLDEIYARKEGFCVCRQDQVCFFFLFYRYLNSELATYTIICISDAVVYSLTDNIPVKYFMRARIDNMQNV